MERLLESQGGISRVDGSQRTVIEETGSESDGVPLSMGLKIGICQLNLRAKKQNKTKQQQQNILRTAAVIASSAGYPSARQHIEM